MHGNGFKRWRMLSLASRFCVNGQGLVKQKQLMGQNNLLNHCSINSYKQTSVYKIIKKTTLKLYDQYEYTKSNNNIEMKVSTWRTLCLRLFFSNVLRLSASLISIFRILSSQYFGFNAADEWSFLQIGIYSIPKFPVFGTYYQNQKENVLHEVEKNGTDLTCVFQIWNNKLSAVTIAMKNHRSHLSSSVTVSYTTRIVFYL